MDYTTRNHSKYCLMAHLIFVCKYRKRLLDRLGVDVKPIMYTIAEDNDFGIVEMETDKDHIHLLIGYNPTQSILDIVRLLKQIPTYRIWRNRGNIQYLRKHFWKENTFWSDGYFACSIGQVSKDVIEKYIQTQG
jgi:putative transposase